MTAVMCRGLVGFYMTGCLQFWFVSRLVCLVLPIQAADLFGAYMLNISKQMTGQLRYDNGNRGTDATQYR